MPSPTLDVAALIAAMERFGVAETVMDEVSTAVDANPGMPIADVVALLKAKGVSVMNANRIKNAMVPPSTSSLPMASSQSAALSSQPAVRVPC
jgi:predicted xylose isomerase-like sugar epimerase